MNKQKKRKIDSYMKLLITCVIIHGMICITASYVLTFLGHDYALESLSQTMASEIVAPVVTYGFTKLIENVFKYNDFPGIKKNNGGEEE